MVATERMKRAETEEELSQTRLEKDALHQALKLIEGENGRLRSANTLLDVPLTNRSDTPTHPPTPSSPQPPTALPTSNVTQVSSPEIPGHLSAFVLQPAPKPSLAGLHRKTASMEKSTTDLSVSSFNESSPPLAALPPVPLIPDEPSPWADVAS